MAKRKPETRNAALANWAAVNDFLRDASEEEAAILLKQEQEGQRRVQYLMRIYARFNRCRGKRERSELLGLK